MVPAWAVRWFRHVGGADQPPMVHATASRHIELLLSPSDEAIELMLSREMTHLGDLRDRYVVAA
jgi:hypothetical protein